MEVGLATFVLEPAFVLSLFVGAFHTCIYIFVRGNLGWHIPGLFVGAVLGEFVNGRFDGTMRPLAITFVVANVTAVLAWRRAQAGQVSFASRCVASIHSPPRRARAASSHQLW